MISLPEPLKNIKVTLATVAFGLGCVYGVWVYADGRYLLAADYRQDKLFAEQRAISGDLRKLEVEVKVLEAKKQFTPASFTRIEEITLKEKTKQLEALNGDLKDVEERQRGKK